MFPKDSQDSAWVHIIQWKYILYAREIIGHPTTIQPVLMGEHQQARHSEAYYEQSVITEISPHCFHYFESLL